MIIVCITPHDDCPFEVKTGHLYDTVPAHVSTGQYQKYCPVLTCAQGQFPLSVQFLP